MTNSCTHEFQQHMGPQLFRGKNVDAARVVPVLDDLHRLWGERVREGGAFKALQLENQTGVMTHNS